MELRNCPLAELRQADNHSKVVVWASLHLRDDDEASNMKLDNGTIVWMCDMGLWNDKQYIFIEAASRPAASGWVALRNLKRLRPPSRPMIAIELPEE